jgi:thiamine pyrophosphate-dependent acetolactate synthase large subunit-like protein
MTEQTKHKPDPLAAASHLSSIMWDFAMMAKYDDVHGIYVERSAAKLRAALEALEGPAK